MDAQLSFYVFKAVFFCAFLSTNVANTTVTYLLLLFIEQIGQPFSHANRAVIGGLSTLFVRLSL